MYSTKKHLLSSLLLFIFGISCALQATEALVPKEGDIVFQSLPHNSLVDAIEGATHSPFSHCGLVVERNGDLEVLEALDTVHYTPWSEWKSQGRKGAFWIYRFKKEAFIDITQVRKAAEKYLGRPYDIHYSFYNSEIYCSELIFLAFREVTGRSLGKVRKLGELDWGPHVEVIKKIEGGNVPLERVMITPVDLAGARELMAVTAETSPSKK